MSELFTIENSVTSSWPDSVVIYTDGASRGNPGPASIGVCVQSVDGEVVYEYGACLGDYPNNHAEYTAVEYGLGKAIEVGAKSVVLRSDSQLLVRQLIGEYKVKSEALRPLFENCRKLSAQLSSVKYEHVRREFNKRADELANMALDRRNPF
jgi:ribonuclease HI